MGTVETVTEEQIESIIKDEQYIHPENTTLTICLLTLENGFIVTGESAAADSNNYIQELGEKYARENAVNKIWALEGYLLKQRLYEA